MRANFHESYAQGEVQLPTDRSTGLVFAAVALIVAVLWRGSPGVLWSALAAAAVLVALSVLAPAVLRPLNVLWFRIGLLLHRVVNPLVLFLIFAVVFVPAGAIMRLFSDPLRRRRAGASSYWVERGNDPKGSMTDQF